MIAHARAEETASNVRDLRPTPRAWDHDDDAEESVLGALFVDHAHEPGPVWGELSAILTADDFHSSAHAAVYRAFAAIIGRGGVLDGVTVTAELRAMNCFESVGGETFLARIIGRTTTTTHAVDHARIIVDHRARRDVANIGRGLATRAHDLSRPIDATMAGALATMEGVRLPVRAMPRTMSADVEQYYDAVEGSIDPGKLPVATGLADFDAALCGGLRTGSYLLIGMGGEGKTTLIGQMAAYVAATRGPVLFAEKEESRAAMRDKFIANLARVSLAKVVAARRGLEGVDVSQDELAAICKALNALDALPLYLYALDDKDSPNTINDLFAVARAMNPRPVLILGDNLGEFQARGNYAPSDVAGPTREKMVDLRNGAQSLDVPVLTLAHPKGGVAQAKRRMALGDIAGGENGGKLCAGAFFLHNEERNPTRGKGAPPPTPGVLELYSDKLRGPVSSVFCEIQRLPGEHRFASTRHRDPLPPHVEREQAAAGRPGAARTDRDRDLLDAYGAGDGLPGAIAPAAQPALDLGPQYQDGAA